MALDEAPPFWWKPNAWQGWLLSPFGMIFGRVSGARMDVTAEEAVNAPVICVGNFIAGGAGKTPTVQMVCKYLAAQNYKPGILSRGYGGAVTSATVVNPDFHNARDVGDEALLHATSHTTVVSANRPTGAKLLIEQGCDFIVMDDGFQTPSLVNDYSLVVVDSKRGLGNGFTMPAGPLRVPLARQLHHTDSVLVIGDHDAGINLVRKIVRSGRQVFHATVSVIGRSKLRGKKVLAFAGIADPTKFYDSLEAIDVRIMDRESFGDHHYFLDEECDDLMERAEKQDLMLITTSKDHARLREMGEKRNRLAELTQVLNIELVPENPTMLAQITKKAVQNFKDRKRLEQKQERLSHSAQKPENAD